MSLGEKLRALRTQSWNSLTGFARKVPCSPALISLIERGERFPSSAILAQIAHALGTTAASLKQHDDRRTRQAGSLLELASDPGLIPLGKKIRHLRSQRGMSLKGLARKAGCSPAFLCRVEQSRNYPLDPLLAKIAEVLGTTAAALKRHDNRPPTKTIRKRIIAEPEFGLALRAVIDSNVSADELMRFLEARKSPDARRRPS